MVFFDRSWYNRAGVERALGYCSCTEYLEFMRQAPELERMLVRSGIHLVKFWFRCRGVEQQTRFVIRQVDPVPRWKLSATDLASLERIQMTTLPAYAIQPACSARPHAPGRDPSRWGGPPRWWPVRCGAPNAGRTPAR
jgi:hypothetical protein